MNKTINEDIINILSDSNIPWSALKSSTILITGATGLVGTALVRALAAANKQHGLKINIIGHGRNADKGIRLTYDYGIEFRSGDTQKPLSIKENIDYIFHCAAITSSAEIVANPVNVIDTEAIGTRNILDLALSKNSKSIVYLSSMEVYGHIDKSVVNESDLGYIDLTNPRSSYPESKRFCEMLCTAYLGQYGLPVKIARLAQTFGAGTQADDTRVFAQFARSAIANEDIELHTVGKSRGNYSYISDTVRGLLTILTKGKNGEIYNVANPKASATIREMAEIVANVVTIADVKATSSDKIKVIVNIPENIEKCGYAPDVGYIINADKLMALGWQPKYELAEMYKRLIDTW